MAATPTMCVTKTSGRKHVLEHNETHCYGVNDNIGLIAGTVKSGILMIPFFLSCCL